MVSDFATADKPLILLDGDEEITLGKLLDDYPVMANLVFTVPSGFETDGASIPRALWRLCGHPLEVPRIYAAVAHDFLYGGGVKGVTRAEADECYYLLLRHFGIAHWKASVEYWALRLCGGSHWTDETKTEKE